MRVQETLLNVAGGWEGISTWWCGRRHVENGTFQLETCSFNQLGSSGVGHFLIAPLTRGFDSSLHQDSCLLAKGGWVALAQSPCSPCQAHVLPWAVGQALRKAHKCPVGWVSAAPLPPFSAPFLILFLQLVD